MITDGKPIVFPFLTFPMLFSVSFFKREGLDWSRPFAIPLGAGRLYQST